MARRVASQHDRSQTGAGNNQQQNQLVAPLALGGLRSGLLSERGGGGGAGERMASTDRPSYRRPPLGGSDERADGTPEGTPTARTLRSVTPRYVCCCCMYAVAPIRVKALCSVV